MKILYFAQLRERIGTTQEEVAIPAGVTTVTGLIDFLKTRSPAHEIALSQQPRLKVAVNQTYARADSAVADADEVAIFPPVTGG